MESELFTNARSPKVETKAEAAANFDMESELYCSLEQGLCISLLYTTVYTVSKYRGFDVYSMNKTGGGEEHV
jgi:hypothetical protein